MDKFETWLVFESNRTNRPLSNESAMIIEETLAQYRTFKAEMIKEIEEIETREDETDPLIVLWEALRIVKGDGKSQ